MIHFDKSFGPTATNLFRISRDDVRSVMQKPDHQEMIWDVDKIHVSTLYLRTLTGGQAPREVLLQTRPDGGDEIIHAAFPVPPSGEHEGYSPLEKLRWLAESFGVPFKLGTQRSRSVVSERVPTPQGREQLVVVENAPSGASLLGLTHRTGDVVMVTLAFVWLSGRRGGLSTSTSMAVLVWTGLERSQDMVGV